MSDQPTKRPQNVPGKFYVTEDCLACEACQQVAPNNFRYAEDGLSFVFNQPGSLEEEKQCEEAVANCPLAAVKSDGQLVVS